MNGKVAKLIRQQARPIEVALTNEQITRGRVDQIEAVLRRNLIGRLRWLLRGC